MQHVLAMTKACRTRYAPDGEQVHCSVTCNSPILLLPTQEIARFCNWNLSAMQTKYMLTSLKPSSLLAYGGWPSAQPFTMYWREGLEVVVPAHLIDLLMPWLSGFTTATNTANKTKDGGAPTCANSLVLLLPYLASVVVQDALDLCSAERPDAYKANPVHVLLLADASFRWVWCRRVELCCWMSCTTAVLLLSLLCLMRMQRAAGIIQRAQSHGPA